LGRKDEAESYYRRAIAADPKWSEPKNELAGILISGKRCEEAEQLLLAVTQDIFYPAPEFAEHNLALALSCQGRQEEAVSKLDALVTKRPQFCLGYLTLSQLSAQTRQPETTVKACEDFDRYCAKNEKIKEQVTPDHVAVCYLRSGMAHAQMGDVESARTSFMRCQDHPNALAKECEKALAQLPQ
jgi:Tfp pilus assembly protein PilF